MSQCRTVFCFSLLAVVMASGAAAFGDDGNGVFRFGAAWVSPTGDFTTDVDGVTGTLEADEEVGLWIEYEHRFSDKFGLDFNLSRANHDVIASAQGLSVTAADIDVMPFLVSAAFYVDRSESVDIYIGPTVGYVFLGDLESSLVESATVDDDFAFGGVIGLDAPLGSGKWSFSGNVRYLKFAAESGGDDLDIDPIVVQVGAGVRF